jgi:hypothetical protein
MLNKNKEGKKSFPRCAHTTKRKTRQEKEGSALTRWMMKKSTKKESLFN